MHFVLGLQCHGNNVRFELSVTMWPLFLLLITSANSINLRCYQCGLDDQEDHCSTYSNRWNKQQCKTSATLNSNQALACYLTVFKDPREGEQLERRGCSVVNLDHIGNCTSDKVSYDGKVVDGTTCYCHDDSLCNQSTSISSSIMSFITAATITLILH